VNSHHDMNVRGDTSISPCQLIDHWTETWRRRTLLLAVYRCTGLMSFSGSSAYSIHQAKGLISRNNK